MKIIITEDQDNQIRSFVRRLSIADKIISELDPKDICVLMLYDDYYAKLAEVTIDKNVKQYCDLHGYTLISHKIENIDNHRAPQWQKIQVSIKSFGANLLMDRSTKRV